MDINWKMKGRKILKKLSKTDLYRYHTVYQLPKYKYICFWDWEGNKHFGYPISFRWYGSVIRIFSDDTASRWYAVDEIVYWKYVIR